MNYFHKYQKYKSKYLELKGITANHYGGNSNVNDIKLSINYIGVGIALTFNLYKDTKYNFSKISQQNSPLYELPIELHKSANALLEFAPKAQKYVCRNEKLDTTHTDYILTHVTYYEPHKLNIDPFCFPKEVRDSYNDLNSYIMKNLL